MTAVRWAVDVGNSRVKVGIFRGDGKPAVHQQANGDLDDSWITSLLVFGRPARVAAAAVDSLVADRFERLLLARGVSVTLALRSDGGVFRAGWLEHDLETPETTGVDRLLSAIGARLEMPGEDLLVVDCGSAITVSGATAAGVFRGGAILPGLRLSAASLHRGTAALPEIHLDRLPPPLGRSTNDSIAAGIAYGAVGAIERLVEEMQSLFERPAIFLTGGDASLLQPALRFPHRLSPYLVLEGLDWAAAQRSAPLR